MATFIEAHLQDMDTCRRTLDSLGEDVRTMLKSMDGFLNARAEMNGQAIFANWQSKARDLFVQKVQVVLESLNAIATECDNASAVLVSAINSYSDADKASAGLLSEVKVEPIPFEHFSDAST